MSKIPVQFEVDLPKLEMPWLTRFLNEFLRFFKSVVFVINGNIDFGDGTVSVNINGAWISVTTPVAVNTDFTVTHNLGRIPAGYWPMTKSAACDVYTGSVSATTTQLTLRATGSTTVLKLFVV